MGGRLTSAIMTSLLQLGDSELKLGAVTHVMGVINLSPDSKNVHTIAHSPDEALLMADRYRRWGASLIDVGGQSSHYDNPTIAAGEEAARVVPVIEGLAAEGHLVAIDTWKPEVAEAAVAAGAVIVNDTGGLTDPAMRRLAAETGVAVIVVHVEGENPHAVGEVDTTAGKVGRMVAEFESLLAELSSEGVSNVIVDPGIALNYRGDYEAYQSLQLEVIAGSDELRALGRPILIPIPRKRDSHRVAAFVALALEHGADIIRAHDVALACDLTRLFRRSA